MGWKASRRQIQVRLLYRQNRWLLNLLLAWLLFFFVGLVMTGHSPGESLAILAFLQEDHSHLGYFYASMTDIVIFGLVISVLLVDMQRQVRPEATCRVMAEELHRHAIIFHFTNLGRRTWQLLVDHDIPVTVVDPDPANLEELIRDGYPCLVGSGRTAADLDAVNVKDARFVMICSDHLESAAVICSLVRQRNPKCDLVARCADDDIGEVLSKRYQATVVSTSRVASQFLREYLTKNKVERCVLIGGGQLGRRMIPIVEELEHEFSVVAAHDHDVSDLLDKSHYIVGRFTDDRILEQAGVVDAQLVLFTEDDFSLAMATIDRVRGLNHKCRIVCRVFMDDAADLMHSEPFNCDIFSTSRQAVEQLRQQGAFKVLGLTGAGRGAAPVAGSEVRSSVRHHPPHEQKPHIKQKIGSR
ncbi:MAG: NAD-binding protein [Candidatus Eremiobacteraeota bacterium]|nr:NAD-binding protein [Candidatus Eremiobacteraeota bacterium]